LIFSGFVLQIVYTDCKFTTPRIKWSVGFTRREWSSFLTVSTVTTQISISL